MGDSGRSYWDKCSYSAIDSCSFSKTENGVGYFCTNNKVMRSLHYGVMPISIPGAGVVAAAKLFELGASEEKGTELSAGELEVLLADGLRMCRNCESRAEKKEEALEKAVLA